MIAGASNSRHSSTACGEPGSHTISVFCATPPPPRVTSASGGFVKPCMRLASPKPGNCRQISGASAPGGTSCGGRPRRHVVKISLLAEERRGKYKSTEYLSPHKVKLSYVLPLSEIIVDFYDKIKSLTRGYGSLDYEFKGYGKAELVKLDILINSEVCDALSSIVHKDKAVVKGRALVERLRELIPRQLFEVAIQAAIGNNIIARQSVRPLTKHVTGKCYGGDITRKRKLWEKQKMGKKRMKRFGRVQIPQEAFMAALKT